MRAASKVITNIWETRDGIDDTTESRQYTAGKQ